MKTTCSTSKTSASSLFEKVCAGVFLCNKSVSLYPKDHPMIRKSLGALKDSLARHAGELGTSFTVRTDEEPCPAEGEDAGPPESRDGAELVRLLKRYFIKKLTIDSEASLEELFQVCYLLREDPDKGGGSPENARITFDEWKHVRVEFYESDDLADGTIPDVAVLEAAAAPHLSGGVQAWLEGLPAEVQDATKQALKKPQLLAEFMELRQALQEDMPSLQVAIEAEKIDFVKEVLRLSGPKPSRVEDVDPAVQSVISTLRTVTRFLADNRRDLEALSSGSSSGKDVETLVKGFKDPSSVNPSLRLDAGRIQSQRGKLDFLFQLIRGGAAFPVSGPPSGGHGAPPPPPAATPGAVAPPAPREGDRPDVGSLKAQLEKIAYDLSAFQRACRSVDSERRFLRIVQELLSADGSRQEIQGKWSSIAKSIASALAGCGSPEEAVQLVMESFKGSDGPETYDIIGELLCARGDPEDVSRAIQKAVLPQGGPAAAREILARMVASSEVKGVRVLAVLLKKGAIAIRQVAASLLGTSCTHLESVVAWVKADPSCLVRPEVRKRLEEAEPGKVFEAFHGVFKESSAEESTMVLQAAPAGAREMEPIILAAIEHGPPSVRKLGLLQLPRFRIASGVKLLMDIIVENNRRESPRMSDVEAALEALADMKDPRAAAFLGEIAHERRWFRHVWRREIRDALRLQGRGSGGFHAARR